MFLNKIDKQVTSKLISQAQMFSLNIRPIHLTELSKPQLNKVVLSSLVYILSFHKLFHISIVFNRQSTDVYTETNNSRNAFSRVFLGFMEQHIKNLIFSFKNDII